MYVEKTTAEERGIIGSKVEGLITQFDTCQTLLQDIVENPARSHHSLWPYLITAPTTDLSTNLHQERK